MRAPFGRRISGYALVFILFLLGNTAAGQALKVGDEITLTTVKGEKVSGKIATLDAKRVVITYPGGGSGIFLTDLSTADQLRLGYDAAAIAKKAEEERKAQSEKEREAVELREIKNANYTVEVSPYDKRKPQAGQSCQIVFSGKVPRPSVVDRILRRALEETVQKYPSQEVLAMAFLGDDTLTRRQYHGPLIYNIAEKRIMTMDDYSGVIKTGTNMGPYYLEIKQDKTMRGILPENKWLSLSLVFSQEPTSKDAYDYAIAEVTKAATQNLEVHACVYVGDKSDTTTWDQKRDSESRYMCVDYDPKTKSVTRGPPIRREIVKRLP